MREQLVKNIKSLIWKGEASLVGATLTLKGVLFQLTEFQTDEAEAIVTEVKEYVAFCEKKEALKQEKAKAVLLEELLMGEQQ